MGHAATLRVLEVAHEPFRFEGDRDVVPQRTVDGRSSFLLRLDDDGGLRFVHLRVWRGRGGLAGMAERFRTSPGFLAWNSAVALVDAGIATPRPMAVAERKHGALEWSLFASEQVDAAISLEQVMQQVASWGEARQAKFARALGGKFGAFRAKRLAIEDFSASSFLVRGVPDFEFELLVVDPERASLGGQLDPGQIRSRILFGLPDRAVKAFFSGME